MGLKILSISNNYGSKTDGIGKFASIIGKNMIKDERVDCFDYETGYTNDNSIVRKILSMEMTKAINRAVKDVWSKRYDCVIVEYPFQEYNPLIIPFYRKLSRVCEAKACKLILSLHEYTRASNGRKKVIDILMKYSDKILVSNDETKKAIALKANEVGIRMISSNIYPVKPIDIKAKKSNFVYFGLVNKSKAFDEMIHAWQCFEKSEETKLIIITSSNVDSYKFPQDVEVIQDADDVVVSDIMSECKYAIIPVVPEVSEINTTFKTAALCGCICIGKFCTSYAGLDFVMNLSGYDVKAISNAMRECLEMSEEDVCKKNEIALDYAKAFGVEKTVEQIVSNI